MSSFLRSKGKHKKTSTSVIERPGINWRENSQENSSLILSVVNEAATLAPNETLKQAACSALFIFQTTQMVKENKEAYELLGLGSVELITTIWHSFKKAEDPENWLSAEIREILEDISDTLETIRSFVIEQLSKNKVIRVIFSKADGVKINEYREHLSYAMQKFNLQSQMNINDLLTQPLKKNEDEAEMKHTLEIKPCEVGYLEMASIYIANTLARIANFLLPPPSPMVSSSPWINQGLPFVITKYLPENGGYPYSAPMSALAEGIWKSILTWVETQILEQEKQETQTLKMILLWIRNGGRKALEQAEFDLKKRSVKPNGIIQHIEQLLQLMEEKCLHQLEPHGPSPEPTRSMSASLPEGVSRVFKDIREEIRTLSELRHFILGEHRLEERLSNALNKILRLSSWTPSSTHNSRVRGLLRNALGTLRDLGGNKEYHDCLRNFMKRRTALCAFMLENANAIAAEDSGMTLELCKNLRRLAQNLGKIASTKAEQYENLYENFIANKEGLSHWLDSAIPGQGRSLVDGFTDSLKNMASSMRREANFWNSQSNLFHIWPNIKETYGCDIDAMPPFPSEQLELNDHRSSTTPSIHDSDTQDAEPEPQRVPQAAQRVSATFADLRKLRVNTTQAFLAKTENSISKRMHETRGYLEFVVDVAEKQLLEPAEGCTPKVIVRLAEKASCIAKQWNKLQRKVKYWGSILSIFSKPLACQTFDMASGISRDDFVGRVIATPDTLIHPYVIEFELCLRDMWHHFLSRKHFWAGIDSDPATFPLEYALAHNPIAPHPPPHHILSISHLLYIILSILILSILSILICF